MKKIIRIATIPLSLNIFCRGLLAELAEEYDTVAVTSPGEGFEEISRREGVRTVAVPMQRSISPLKDLRALIMLTRLFEKERPDMVHSITPKAGLLAMMAARRAGVPVRVHTFTGLLFPTARGLKRRLLMLTDRITCACATHIIPEGEGIKNDLLDNGITDKPMQVLGQGNVRGIDIRHYDRTPEVAGAAAGIRRSLGIAGSDFVFIFAGRIVADKGMAELMKAFSRLRDVHSNVRLLLVGGEERKLSPLDRKTRKLMDRLCHGGALHVVQWQDDLRPWYAAADALVFPSHREGFPNVVIEAGAMGLPSIVTDINGSREIIIRGKNGVIVPPRDAESLYEAMRSFVEQPEMTRLMSTHARPLIMSRYEQGYVRRCLKVFYHSILQ